MKKLIAIIASLFLYISLFGQSAQVDGKNPNSIITAVPFLSIGPDPVSGAMGECGVATGNDVYSIHWNPAKYALNKEAYESSENSFGSGGRLGVFYSPWLRSFARGINFYGVYGTQRISNSSALSGSFRLIDFGDIRFTNIYGSFAGKYSPYEWAADMAWSQKLSDHWYGAVAGRFIFSNISSGQIIAGKEIKPATSVAADLACYYLDILPVLSPDDELSLGINISNIGSKMNYLSNDPDHSEFIPTNLRLGASYLFFMEDNQTLRVSIDLNKLLVPTPPQYLVDTSGHFVLDENNEPIIFKGMSTDVSVLMGMIQSFYDAPEGFSEELKEITIGGGVEYTIYDIVSFRGGYFYENETKGNRHFLTLGGGLHYNFISGNVSIIMADRTNPLHNTWRFGLSVAL